jgi:hypothetical protein
MRIVQIFLVFCPKGSFANLLTNTSNLLPLRRVGIRRYRYFRSVSGPLSVVGNAALWPGNKNRLFFTSHTQHQERIRLLLCAYGIDDPVHI